MGSPTKVQLIKRKQSEQWYINFPAAIAQAMEFERGETVEWFIEDKGTLALKRQIVPPYLLKKNNRNSRDIRGVFRPNAPRICSGEAFPSSLQFEYRIYSRLGQAHRQRYALGYRQAVRGLDSCISPVQSGTHRPQGALCSGESGCDGAPGAGRAFGCHDGRYLDTHTRP